MWEVGEYGGRGRYFDGAFPPDTVTFAGAVALKVAIGVDNREALVRGFCEVSDDMASYFPQAPMDHAEVAHLVDVVIRDHNALVTTASQDALSLFEAYDAMTIAGIVYSFAEAGDADGALEQIAVSAQELAAAGVAVRGYCVATAADADELIMTGELGLRYGIFAETGSTLDEIRYQVEALLRAHGLSVRPDLSAEQRFVVGPMRYEVPYHGGELEPADAMPDGDPT